MYTQLNVPKIAQLLNLTLVFASVFYSFSHAGAAAALPLRCAVIAITIAACCQHIDWRC